MSSESDWIGRVDLTLGSEALCDRNWRFVAASAPLLADLDLTRERLVGRAMPSVKQFRNYAAALAQLPFFDGELHGVHFFSESWVADKLMAWDMDMWAVQTIDGVSFVHIVATKARPSRGCVRFDGFRMSGFRVTLVDGRVLGGDADTSFG